MFESTLIRNNPNQATTISTSNLDDCVDSNKLTKLIIRGFNDRAQNKWIINTTKELLKIGLKFFHLNSILERRSETFLGKYVRHYGGLVRWQ